MLTPDLIETIPTMLRLDEDGALRVGASRVIFELVIGAFREGETAEGIVERFPSLELPSVYAAIAWCLLHPEEAERYLEERAELGAQLRAEIEEKFPANGLRGRLLARWGAQKRDLPAA